ncbi:MAG: hypothetical protein ACYTG7_25025, partial [Planctomycetota bacterium]
MLRKKYLIPCLWMICFLAALCPEGKGLPEETLIGQLSMRLIEENDVLTGYRDVVGAFRKEAKRYEAPCLLKAMEQILSDPFSLEPVTLSISEELAQHAVKGGRKDLKGLFAAAAGVIDCSVGEVEVPAFEGGGSVEDHLAHIEKVLDAAAALRANALTNLNEEEKQLAYVTLASVLDKFIDGVYLETGADEATLSNYNRGLEVLSKIDCGAMAEAALVLSSLASPDYVKRVEKHFKKLKVKAPAEAKDAGFTGDVLAFRDTPHGPVVIGGKKTTKYKAQAAFILDLGGADTYNAAASTLDLERGISMVVDLDGKDKYLVKDAMNLVACRLGVAVLFDLKGNDVYEGTRGTQGLGEGGVALLWDEEGKDRYKA